MVPPCSRRRSGRDRVVGDAPSRFDPFPIGAYTDHLTGEARHDPSVMPGLAPLLSGSDGLDRVQGVGTSGLPARRPGRGTVCGAPRSPPRPPLSPRTCSGVQTRPGPVPGPASQPPRPCGGLGRQQDRNVVPPTETGAPHWTPEQVRGDKRRPEMVLPVGTESVAKLNRTAMDSFRVSTSIRRLVPSGYGIFRSDRVAEVRATWPTLPRPLPQAGGGRVERCRRRLRGGGRPGGGVPIADPPQPTARQVICISPFRYAPKSARGSRGHRRARLPGSASPLSVPAAVRALLAGPATRLPRFPLDAPKPSFRIPL